MNIACHDNITTKAIVNLNNRSFFAGPRASVTGPTGMSVTGGAAWRGTEPEPGAGAGAAGTTSRCTTLLPRILCAC